MESMLFESTARAARVEETCPQCKGRGFVRRQAEAREIFCPSCGGSGRIARAVVVAEEQTSLF
jgi:DnaJ-class molecular chaperone